MDIVGFTVTVLG